MSLLLITLSGLMAAAWFLSQEDSPLFRPIQQYKLTSANEHVTAKEIDRVMQSYLGLSFWEVDLEAIQSELIRLDWASSARVKRSWPDQLYVQIEEQTPAARWGESALVNQRGVVFYPTDLKGFDNLVVLEGQLSESANILMALSEYQAVLSPIKFIISRIQQKPDGVWVISTLKGSSIVLDKTQPVAKLKSFVAAYAKLSKALRKSPQVYDLRYSNGFIIGKIKSLILPMPNAADNAFEK
ncbi:MAG: FtsQ-type POTRA domain-containing protein [Gammaproteobacteria bacterium]|nr:FtsQ-type POTRA domain-containing protein [Gammaproteobacteria bacterium]